MSMVAVCISCSMPPMSSSRYMYTAPRSKAKHGRCKSRTNPHASLYIYIMRRHAIAMSPCCGPAGQRPRWGRTVVSMVEEIPGLTIDTVKSHDFITILLACTDPEMSGRSVPNFRKAITNAWYGRKD